MFWFEVMVLVMDFELRLWMVMKVSFGELFLVVIIVNIKGKEKIFL